MLRSVWRNPRVAPQRRASHCCSGGRTPVKHRAAASLVLLALAVPVRGQDLAPLPSQAQAPPDWQVQVPPLPLAGRSPAPSPMPPGGEISATSSFQALSDSLQSWTFVQLRGLVHAGRSDVWAGEIVDEREFGDAGIFLGVANTHTFNPDWFAYTAAGT